MTESKPPERPEWAHEYMRYSGDGQWICDGCPLESCDCDKYVDDEHNYRTRQEKGLQ